MSNFAGLGQRVALRHCATAGALTAGNGALGQGWAQHNLRSGARATGQAQLSAVRAACSSCSAWRASSLNGCRLAGSAQRA